MIKKAGFFFFDLIGAFAISTILITMVIISVSFLSSRQALCKEYLYAKNLLYKTIFSIKQGIFNPIKTEEIGNILFTITEEKIVVSHTTIDKTLIAIPAVAVTISWKNIQGTEEKLTFLTFDHGTQL